MDPRLNNSNTNSPNIPSEHQKPISLSSRLFPALDREIVKKESLNKLSIGNPINAALNPSSLESYAKATVLFKALGINRLPEEPTSKEKSIHEAKEKFITSIVGDKRLIKMGEMAECCPLFNSAKQSLGQNFEMWDEIANKPKDLNRLQNKIIIQCQNLTHLQELLEAVASERLELLQALPLLALDKDISPLLHMSILGEEDIADHIDDIEYAIRQALEAIKLEIATPSLKTLAKNRSNAAVSTQSIIKEADLFHAERKAKLFASASDQLIRFGTSKNFVVQMTEEKGVLNLTPIAAEKLLSKEDNKWVLCQESGSDFAILITKSNGKIQHEKFRIFSDRPGVFKNIRGKRLTFEQIKATINASQLKPLEVPFAYYKRGDGGEMAAGIMEKLMWDVAVLMGLESQFAATKLSALRTKNEMQGGPETELILNAEGQINLKNGLKSALKGGIQEAQDGFLLIKYILNPNDFTVGPKRESVIQGTLTSLVFGMCDAHAKNVIFDREGNIIFFDNTRSLPHSNTFIDRGKGIYSSYRSALLCLPVSYEPLTSNEIYGLKSDLQKIENKMVAVEQFLKSPHMQGQIENLPPGWFNTEESIAAMKERINNIKVALNNTSKGSYSLRDLCFDVNPEFKFNAALQILENIPNLYELEFWNKLTLAEVRNIQRKSMGIIGYESIKDLLMKCASHGIDPWHIKNLCLRPNLDFDQIVGRIAVVMGENAQKQQGYSSLLQKQSKLLLSKIKSNAKKDYKDQDRTSIEKYSVNLLKLSAKAEKVYYQNFKNFGEAFDKYLQTLNNGTIAIALDRSKPPHVQLYCKSTSGEMRAYDMDLSVTNKVILKIEGAELPPLEFKEAKVLLESTRKSSKRTLFDYVENLIVACKDTKINLEVVSNREALEKVKQLLPGEILIAQKHAADPPQFKMYRKKQSGDVESFPLVVVEKEAYFGRFAIRGSKEKLSVPIKMEDLPNYKSETEEKL